MQKSNRLQQLARLIKALRETDAIRGVSFHAGVTRAMFTELLAGCFLNYREAKSDLEHRRKEFGGSDYLKDTKIRTTLRRAAKVEWLPIAREAEQLLNLPDHLAQLGKPYIERAEARVRQLDPILCLYVLFRCLVKMDRRRKKAGDRSLENQENLEWYMETQFRPILEAADIAPERARAWTKANIERHFYRQGGINAALQIAGSLLSVHPSLKRYRPEPTFHGMAKALGEYGLTIQGQLTYLYRPPKSPVRLDVPRLTTPE